MFDIYKYDRRLLDDYMEICNDLETALRSFDTLHSDIMMLLKPFRRWLRI